MCNVLQRPIHVYELGVENFSAADIKGETSRDEHYSKRPTFILKRMACFGSPRFDGKPALHILSADSRFPDLQPGQQSSAGNHFLSVFPDVKIRRRKRIRGGAGNAREDSTTEDPFAGPLLSSRLLWWFQDVMQCIGI